MQDIKVGGNLESMNHFHLESFFWSLKLPLTVLMLDWKSRRTTGKSEFTQRVYLAALR